MIYQILRRCTHGNSIYHYICHLSYIYILGPHLLSIYSFWVLIYYLSIHFGAIYHLSIHFGAIYHLSIVCQQPLGNYEKIDAEPLLLREVHLFFIIA